MSALVDKVMSRVDKGDDGGCWTYIGPLNTYGYGVVWFDGRTRYGVHRIAYQHLVGPVPDGLVLDHLCRNRACVKPAHLEPVTNRENLLRGQTKAAENARKTHCSRGHEFTTDNIKREPNGARGCRECRRLQARERYRRQVAA